MFFIYFFSPTKRNRSLNINFLVFFVLFFFSYNRIDELLSMYVGMYVCCEMINNDWLYKKYFDFASFTLNTKRCQQTYVVFKPTYITITNAIGMNKYRAMYIL